MSVLLLYGATGYSGRLIADAAVRLRRAGDLAGVQLVLAGRDAGELATLAASHGFASRSFALDKRVCVLDALRGVTLVLNTAGPFAATAPRLARSTLESDAHYVDLNGEVDVYRALDDLAPIAARRGVVMVCGAGRIAALSDVLLDDALMAMTKVQRSNLQTVRIAHSMVRHLSRGSLRTSVRSMREQVSIVRSGVVRQVPVGQIERVFDLDLDRKQPARRRCTSSATSFLDTLAAQRTAARRGLPELDIETYMEMRDLTRLAYEMGALGAGMWRMPGLEALAERRIALLPEGPSAEQRAQNRQALVLELENRFRETTHRITADSPDPYAFSAEVALRVALRLLVDPPHLPAPGWCTVSQVLRADGLPLLRELGVRIERPVGTGDELAVR